MSQRLKKFAPTLQCLAKCDKHTAESIIEHGSPQVIDCLSDICHNLLRGKVPLTPLEKKRLAKHKQSIRKVAKKSTIKKTKKALIQKGGFLSAILAPLLGSVIGPLAGKLFGK